jgi:cytochrome c oxidase assembly protein subunit 11
MTPTMTPQKKTASWLAAVVFTMLGLSFAAVPFYDWFCRVTGFGGTTGVAAAVPDLILDQTVLIRFDASTAIDMPWEFKPQQHTMTVRLGENGLAFYEAYNPTSRPIAGTASYNVAPDQAGGYFIKIECFCFTEQVLQPGERVVMPVSFYVDPTMLENAEAAGIPEITLSYTFHQTPLPEQQAGLTGPAVTPSATAEN